jgi:hypothetical protein
LRHHLQHLTRLRDGRTEHLLGILVAALPPIGQSREEDGGNQAPWWQAATYWGFGNRGRCRLQVRERQQLREIQ